MQFVIIGLDGSDNDASFRRAKARPAHLKMGEKLLASGNLMYGSALLHDDGTMKGSVYIVEFPSEELLHKWLEKEPYVVGDVWKEITIHKSSTRDPWQFNRPKEFFLKK